MHHITELGTCGIFGQKKVVFNAKNHKCPALKVAFFWAQNTKTTPVKNKR